MWYWVGALTLLLITYLIQKSIKMRNYFRDNGVPQPCEIPFIGMLGVSFIVKKNMNVAFKEVYNSIKDAKYIGSYSFTTPLIVFRDLELIKSVLVRNFDHFADRRPFIDEKADPLFGKNLNFLNGERWREVRNMLSPAFTSSKLRSMYVLMSKCAENFVQQFLERYKDAEAIDMKDAFTMYASDVIATCAFGIEVDTMRNPENEFYTHGKTSTSNSTTKMFKFFFIRTFPRLSRWLRMRVISEEDTDFFVNLISSTMKMRRERGITRPDMLQLMIEAQDKSSSLDILEMTAQAFIFFLAGFEATSGQLCMLSHELAVNPKIQQQAQEEIDAAMEKNASYDTVNNMPYLDAVYSETLRMHPIPFLTRMVSKDFELPPAMPGLKPYVIRKDMEIVIPVAGIHADENHFENPEVFDPSRFWNKRAMSSDVTSLGFGLGPRMCIGNRFAILVSKVLLVHLLHKVNLVTCEKTCLPLEYSTDNFSPAPKGGCWLKFEPR